MRVDAYPVHIGTALIDETAGARPGAGQADFMKKPERRHSGRQATQRDRRGWDRTWRALG